jgi:hypothetical protein
VRARVAVIRRVRIIAARARSRIAAVSRLRSRDALVAVALVFALAYFMQEAGSNAGSHFALTKALARGTAQVDRTRLAADPRFGVTQDLAFWRGHYYSDKAPGLAFVSLPPYLALHAAGMDDNASPRRFVWLLALWGALLPACVTLLLVRRVADELAPGTGTPTVLALALGTLVLPFSDMLFSHTLSACLCFGAFVLLRGSRRPWRIGTAGLLAGYAITTEYPNVIAAAILGVYAAWRLRRLALAYATGVVAGVLPLLAYDWWAFRSPWRYSRSAELLTLKANPARSGVGGLGAPSLHRIRELLFHHWIGLVVQSPVLVLAALGLVLLYRHGRRAEALVCAAMAVAYVVYLSGFFDPFGAGSPGPRYLVTMLPFLGLGLAPLFARAPRVTAAVALVSIALMVLITSTDPLIMRKSRDPGPLVRFEHRAFAEAAFNPISHAHPLPHVLPYFLDVLLLAGLLVQAAAAGSSSATGFSGSRPSSSS